jgi:hypothetical protein
MQPSAIAEARQRIESETDPTLKALLLASLVSALFRERGVELVVVGGSAIEFFTEGAYVSGDLDLCLLPMSKPLPLKLRQEIMGLLGGEGGPRSWKVCGLFADLLGPVESFAGSAFRRLEAPFGEVVLIQPEDLLVERVLVSFYPGLNEPARQAARKLAAAMLQGRVTTDWAEVWRVAGRPEFQCSAQCRDLVGNVANELGLRNPADPD